MEVRDVAVEEKDFEELKEDVQDLKYKVRDLDYITRALDLEIKELKTAYKETKKEMLDIVRDAATRAPKWLMGIIVSVLLVLSLSVLGWVIYDIIAHH